MTSFLKKYFRIIFGKIINYFSVPKDNFVKTQIVTIHSDFLNRGVTVEINLPPDGLRSNGKLPAAFFNDGQDMEALEIENTLNRLFQQRKVHPFILVAVHAGDRMQEYGTAHQADYAKRGSKARLYSQFLIKELWPYLEKNYPIEKNNAGNAFAGCSLGGLSALDMVWKHSNYFKRVGVFSGSLWWRSKKFDPENPDADRIVHEMIQKGTYKTGLRFWLQAGTADEKSDRNNNGIIDAIDDTLDLIKVLKQLGYTDKEIQYVEVENGKHHPETWKNVLPDFLMFVYGKNV